MFFRTAIVILTISMCFAEDSQEVSSNRKKREANAQASSLPLSWRLPLRQVIPVQQAEAKRPGVLRRRRRAFRSYFYNYLDEMSMSICASLPSQGPSIIYAVRRTCGETATCKNICEDQALRNQAPAEIQTKQWSCAESLHVYKLQTTLADNYDEYTDSHKLGLAVYRHHSCTLAGCGPNYCCCRAE